jgi:hypothetical protein
MSARGSQSVSLIVHGAGAKNWKPFNKDGLVTCSALLKFEDIGVLSAEEIWI